MKSLIVAAFYLLATMVVATAQPQRMLMLPHALQEMAGTPWLCIDFFNADPYGYTYNQVLWEAPGAKKSAYELINNKGAVVEDGRILHNGKEIEPTDGPYILAPSENNAPVHPQATAYFNDLIQKAKAGSITPSSLQNIIWRYSILDKLGYIRNSGDPAGDVLFGTNQLLQDFDAKDVLDVGDRLHTYVSSIKSKNATYVFRNSQGQYIALQNGKLLGRTQDEKQLSQKIVAILNGKKDQEISIYLDEIEGSKAEALLFTMENFTSENIIRGGLYADSWIDRSNISITTKLDATIRQEGSSFRKDFQAEVDFSQVDGTAQSTSREAIKAFIGDVNRNIDDGGGAIQDFSQFSSQFVKKMKQQGIIKSFSQFKILFKTSIGRFIIVKTTRGNIIVLYES